MTLLSKILIASLILICGLLPLTRPTFDLQETWADEYEYYKDKVTNDKLGLLSDLWDGVTEKILGPEEAVPLTFWEKTIDNINSGFGYGISTIGFVERLKNDLSYGIYNDSYIAGCSLLLIITLQFIFNLFNRIRHKLVPILGLLSLFNLVVLIGLIGESENIVDVAFGWLAFGAIQFSILIGFSITKRARDKAEQNL